MDSLAIHSCVYCQGLTIDVRDETASKSSLELFSHHDADGMMDNCPLFEMITKGIPPAELSSGARIQAELSRNENRTTWSITLHVEYTSQGRTRDGPTYFFFIYTRDDDPAYRLIPRLVPNLNPRSPESFETAQVARNLNIPFIWIDALCIVQDDPESMGLELEKMPAIYSNAMFTISAASAKTCCDGFLNPCEALDFNRVIFQLPIRMPSGEEGHIFLAHYDRWARHGESSENEPINERAWTLQEHVVSPRVLYYSSQQLHWICRRGILAEGGFCPTDKDSPWKGHNICRIFVLNQTSTEIVDPSISTALASSLSTHNDKEYDSWLRNWFSRLQNYQARRLTNASDKLVAVSAVGILFARYMHTEFIAGLFSRCLDTDLLWNRVDSSGENPRPAKYRAPSWSWASVDSKTENRTVAGALRKPGDSTIEILPWPDQGTPTGRARIGLEPIELPVRAWMTTASLRIEGTRRVLEGKQWHLPQDSITCSFDAMEAELDTPLGTEILLMEANWYLTNVSRRGLRPGSKVVGLIVLKTGREGDTRYRRVGYFEMQVSSFYRENEARPLRKNILGRNPNTGVEAVRKTVRDAIQAHQRTVILV
ncbi:hypothetical protein NUW58_g8458 [Xylaria curta]|uniref:Uncharacterized protein n=1 Tax=Xylaria curta TaxID=42375 RepID=A0ACC1N831_9PEZI|nr:hypothetical protein NUW58_g8458 [Xylaria curta]